LRFEAFYTNIILPSVDNMFLLSLYLSIVGRDMYWLKSEKSILWNFPKYGDVHLLGPGCEY